MRILVTGGCGFIGSTLVRQLLGDTAQKHEVFNIDKLTYAGHEASVESVAHLEQYHFLQADICDAKILQDVVSDFKPDAIMHLAAESHVDRSIDGPKSFMDTNIMGTFHLLNVASHYMKKKPGFRFLHVSTDEVFGELGKEDVFTEESAYQPNSPYSASKASADMLVRAWGQTYGLPVMITHCGNNYGPYQFPEKLIPLAILRALQGESIPVYAKGENIRDWIHVEDHVRALQMVLAKGKPGETYNIGVKGEKTNLAVIESLCTILDRIVPRDQPYRDLIEFVADRPGHDYRYALSPAKVERDLGFTGMIDFEHGLEQTVAWYIQEQNAWCQQVLQKNSQNLERKGVA